MAYRHEGQIEYHANDQDACLNAHQAQANINASNIYAIPSPFFHTVFIQAGTRVDSFP